MDLSLELDRLPLTSPLEAGPAELGSWLEAQAEQRFGCRVLDLRGGAAAPLDHLPGSAWWPTREGVPLAAFMLPRAERGFLVLGGDRVEELRGRGFRCWPFPGEIPLGALRPGPPEGALWQPDSWLVENLELLPPTSHGPVFDLGCGSGRELTFLALRGYEGVGFDRLEDALDLGAQLALHHGVKWEGWATRIETVDDLGEGSASVVLHFRIVLRPVLRELHRRVRPGGVLVLRSHGPASPEAPRGPRQDRHRLAPEALREDLDPSFWEFERGPDCLIQGGRSWLLAVVRRTARRA